MAMGAHTASSICFSIFAGATSSVLSVASTFGKIFTVSERARISACLAAIIARTPDHLRPRDVDTILWVCATMLTRSQKV